MSNPLDDALMCKEAFFGRVAQGAQMAFKGMNAQGIGSEMAQEAVRAVGGAAAIGALAGVASGAKMLIGAARKKREFGEMLEVNPDLTELQSENPRFFNASYTSLRNMNPTFAKDPIIAGGMMRRMMASPESAGGILSSSIKTPDAPREGLGIQHKFGPLTYSRQL